MDRFKIVSGIAPQHTRRAAELYFEAFSGKIGSLLGGRERGEAFIADVLNPQYALTAVSPDGETLLGIAGYKTAEGALVGGSYEDMRKHYGVLGALWRGTLLSILEREVEPSRLLMDGIAVDRDQRSMGIGSALLNAVLEHAASLGLTEVRLDVIDKNPRARSLYERRGFVAVDTQRLGVLKHLFNFRSATTMVKAVSIVPAVGQDGVTSDGAR